jgi:DnaA family protein
MQQIALDIGLSPAPTLDNFFPGPNATALAHMRQWSPSSAAPTYLWGPEGSGKTHLLQGLRTRLQQQGHASGYLGAQDDPRMGAAPDLLFDDSWSAVFMDDVHSYPPALQQAAFSWFVQAQALGRSVVAAGRQAPVALPLREDLRTRLGWGHVLGLDLLSEAQTRDVLRQAADARGLVLSDEVMDFTLRRFSRDLGSLMQLLDAMDRYALQTQRALTIPLVKSMLENA